MRFRNTSQFGPGQLPTVGVFAKATPKDTPKAVVAETDEAIRSVTEEKAAQVPPSSAEAVVKVQNLYYT